MITLALRLEDVRKIKTQRDPNKKGKGDSSKPESGHRAESAQKRAASELKNNHASRRKGRGRGAGESSSSSNPAKPDADKSDK